MLRGKKIKVLRSYKGISQAELAQKINKTRALVSHVEQTGKVNHTTLIEILKVLNITFEDFENFELKNYKGISNTNDLSLLRKEFENCQKEKDLLKEIVEHQKKIIQMMEKKKK